MMLSVGKSGSANDVDGVDSDGADYNRAVGTRLRALRRIRRLTQHDVERQTGFEFKASVLGAYERGERALSVPRLERLASFYQVTLEEVLPQSEGQQGVPRLAEPPSATIVIDLRKLGARDDAELTPLKRFVEMTLRQRQDFNGRVLSIRNSDQKILAAMYGLSPDGVVPHLVSLDLINHW
jgi:transcriptional regulator with XRE-family HTH domain